MLGTVLHNLEQFPGLGRPFFNRGVGSAETANAVAALQTKLQPPSHDDDALREYVMDNYLVLYLRVDETLFLLSIKTPQPAFIRL